MLKIDGGAAGRDGVIGPSVDLPGKAMGGGELKTSKTKAAHENVWGYPSVIIISRGYLVSRSLCSAISPADVMKSSQWPGLGCSHSRSLAHRCCGGMGGASA